MEPRSGTSPTIFGIDLAWSARNPTGVVAIRRPDPAAGWRLVDRWTVTSDEEILEIVCPRSQDADDEHRGEPPLLAIDAPLIAPNPAGTSRPADREVTRRFARFHAGAYPANRALCPRPLEFAARLVEHGFSLDPRDAIRGRPTAVEVFPHAAAVGLFGLPRILKYKKGPVAVRRRELARFQELLRRELPRLSPPVEPPPDDPLQSLRGAALKAREDLLDAHLAAAAAAAYLTDPARFDIVGDLELGYVLVPRLNG